MLNKTHKHYQTGMPISSDCNVSEYEWSQTNAFSHFVNEGIHDCELTTLPTYTHFMLCQTGNSIIFACYENGVILNEYTGIVDPTQTVNLVQHAFVILCIRCA